LSTAFEAEMTQSCAARAKGDLERAFAHLERAHILGQRHTLPHLRAHWAMLSLGWRRRDARELLGQLPRLLAAAVFSRIWVPIGNTGGANVPAMKQMPVPPDLQALLDA
jgi:hypothetical protein